MTNQEQAVYTRAFNLIARTEHWMNYASWSLALDRARVLILCLEALNAGLPELHPGSAASPAGCLDPRVEAILDAEGAFWDAVEPGELGAQSS